MNRILLAPGRYVQGAGAIKEIGTHAARLGRNAFVIGGNTALKLCGEDIAAGLAAKGLSCRQEVFRGVSSRQVAEMAVSEGETIHATWFAVDANMVEAAIWTADALGERFRKSIGA